MILYQDKLPIVNIYPYQLGKVSWGIGIILDKKAVAVIDIKGHYIILLGIVQGKDVGNIYGVVLYHPTPS